MRVLAELVEGRGWTWNCRLGVAYSGDDRVKAPSCDGAMVSGPLRKKAYSNAICPFHQAASGIPR